MTGVAVRRVRPRAVLLVALRLLRVRHVDRSAAPHRGLPRRRADRDRARRRRRDGAGDERLRRRRHTVARSGRRTGGGARGRSRWRRAPRSRWSATPTTSTEALFETYVAAGVNRVSIGVQSMVPHVLAALGRTHDPANVERAVAAARAVGLPTFNLDIIYGAAGETVADWRTTLERVARPRAAARLGVRPHRRGRHAAGRRSRPAPRRRRPGRRVRAGRRRADGAPGWPTTRCPTGPGPATSAATTSSTGASTTTSGSAAPPTRTGPGGGGGTSARPSATSPRSRAGRSTEAAGETLDGDVRRVEGLQLALRTTAGVPLAALDGDALPGLVEQAGDRWVLTRRGRLMANEVAVRLR